MIAEVTFTSPDRVRDVIHNFNADGFDSLQPQVRRRATTEVHPAPAAGDQEDRAGPAGRSRAAVLHLEPVEAGRLPGRRGGGRRHLPRGPADCCCARRASPFQAVKTWKTSTDPDYEAKKNRVLELYAIADGHRRARPRRPDGGDLHGRVRAAEPPTPPRQAVGAGRGRQRRAGRAAAAPPAGHLHPPARGAAPDGRLRPVHRQALRPRHQPQGPHPVPGLLPLPAHPAPGRRADRDRAGQLQPAPVDQDRLPGRRVGGGEQRRAGLRARSTAPGSTGSRPSSPPCATSPSTAPTTTATASRPA